MNRELKFREWDPFRKKMDLEPEVSDGRDGYSTAYVYLNDAIACHDEILMQFTGLLDSNVKEIYEGDILTISDESGNNYICKVYFRVCEYVLLQSDESLWASLSKLQGLYYQCQVIGNIYENTELMQSNLTETK
jgi:uncharacterized phage protein (TIGR01671 family)